MILWWQLLIIIFSLAAIKWVGRILMLKSIGSAIDGIKKQFIGGLKSDVETGNNDEV
jgi:hypothetical protein